MAGDALALALREPTLGIVECESGARQALVLVQDELLQAARVVPASPLVASDFDEREKLIRSFDMKSGGTFPQLLLFYLRYVYAHERALVFTADLHT